ncbi:PREDICTED: retinoblastoma-like protein 2 [Priapulus caudatus]|uniref:Retinoblastoma-like protein 2 n=1 Tax=Priapulus caudatus TaxID=37621 RepID=A0ABM1EKC5_PRICU|nr:PREDICTED: retinoblastoma-like protein 2 [Priapulus caudatus]
MGLSEDGDMNIEDRFNDLCLELNMDKATRDEAWLSYQNISQNFTLEGDTLHWLACALYVACRKIVVPTVGSGVQEGNGVSLTQLLRRAKLSLTQFFNKMKKWADMANLPQRFCKKVDRLERVYAVSMVIFKKFHPIFLDIFKDPADDAPRAPKSRKQRKPPCNSSELFKFCWTLFVQVKGSFPAISDDLVNSYHLLLCCIDLCYSNALLAGRKDILNPNFAELPDGFPCRDYRPPQEPPCIIQHLCEHHEGIATEAKGIKEHWWKPDIRKLFDRRVLKGRSETLSGLIDQQNFESNLKMVTKLYEEYVLSVGDFDECVFLCADASAEIGTPAKPAEGAGAFAQQMTVKRNTLYQHADPTRTLAPATPLTGRCYLKGRDPVNITPVSTATQSVSRLQGLLTGCKTVPSEMLTRILESCSVNPQETIQKRVAEMGEVFYTKYAQPSEDHPGSHVDFAKSRLQLGESLYFKTLENIMLMEKRRLPSNADFTGLLDQDVFHRSLFAVCLEIVIFSYNSQRTFPWIVEAFDLSPYYLYKVIEVLIKSEDALSRDVVKHLNSVCGHDKPFQEVMRCYRLQPQAQSHVYRSVLLRNRRSGHATNESSASSSPVSTEEVDKHEGDCGPYVVVPISLASAMSSSGKPQSPTKAPLPPPPPVNRPKVGGSLALFFRKVYYLASVRLRDLCEKLELAEDLRMKSWTCLEYALTQYVELMRDRHLDQIVMCCVYVMAKVRASLALSFGCRTERLTHTRSSSTLPVPRPSSHPPTPTQLAGTCSSFESEDRGDLIKFYNSVFVEKVTSFALRFSGQHENGSRSPAISPLPTSRAAAHSPRRRVSLLHSVYISPLKSRSGGAAGTPINSPTKPMLYSFSLSPAKDLRAINHMIKQEQARKVFSSSAGKRLRLDDDGADGGPTKRLCVGGNPIGNGFARRLQGVVADQQVAIAATPP